MCARGILLSDIVHDLVRSAIAPADGAGWRNVCTLFAGMRSEGEALLARDGVASEDRAFRYFIDARYVGQNHEVRVAMDSIDAGNFDAFLRGFADRHTQEYGYDIPDRAVETVNCRVQAIGQVPRPETQTGISSGGLDAALVETRSVNLAGVWIDTPIYRREGLPTGLAFEGPAIVEEMSATTIMLPGQSAVVDESGNIIIETGL
jgi:N-methylhydantoinase A